MENVDSERKLEGFLTNLLISSFPRCVLLPLLNVKPPQQSLFLLVDSIDEGCQLGEGDQRSSPGSPRTIAELLASHHEFLPPWLLLICSARRQNKAITKLFTGEYGVSLNELYCGSLYSEEEILYFNEFCSFDNDAFCNTSNVKRHQLERENIFICQNVHGCGNGGFCSMSTIFQSQCDTFHLKMRMRWHIINQEPECVGGSLLHRLTVLCVPPLPFQNNWMWELLVPSACLWNHYVISQQSKRPFLCYFPLSTCMK